MLAIRIKLSLLLLFVISGVFGNLRDTCDKHTAKEGYVDCVSFPSKYSGSQWAVCAADTVINRNDNYICHAPFCWLPCMGIMGGRKRGMVTQECSCNSSDFKAKIQPPLEVQCYIPDFNDCNWFGSCLSKYKDCPESNRNSVDPFGRYLCSLFDSHSDGLSVSGNRYITYFKECLQREMFYLILPSSNQTCSERTYLAHKAHDHCLNLNSLTAKFCDLPVNDQSYIFWTFKSIMTNSFGGSRNMLDSIRNCYRGNVQSVEKQILITVDAEGWKGVQSTVEDFAQMLNWPSKGIVWDGHNIPQISNSTKAINIIFKPKADFDFTINRQSRSIFGSVDECNRISSELSNININHIPIFGLFCHSRKTAYFPRIGECPYHYGDGGIFDDYLPEYIDTINVQFVLYRKQNSVITKEILDYFNDDSITKSSFDSSKSTYFIIHGFLNDGNEDWIQDMVSAFLENAECNVIVVDWHKGADIPLSEVVLAAILGYIRHPAAAVATSAGKIAMDYIQAAVNTRLVGCLVGKLTEKLTTLMNTPYKDIHITGHSLGAHVSGFAGLYTQGKVGRITGLDPAGPGFRGKGPNFRLDQTDAIFVDIIHSDTLSFGIGQPIGHIDFYPNGGRFQPGCILYGCSHGRAYSLFTESISPACTFWACFCSRDEFDKGVCNTGKTCTRMGFRVDLNKEGSFFLKTNKKSPFCTGKFPNRKRRKRLAKYGSIGNV